MARLNRIVKYPFNKIYCHAYNIGLCCEMTFNALESTSVRV